MNVVFLDYDGVVNTPMWRIEDDKWVCTFNYPNDGRVNNSQAVQWVSNFCEKYGYGIVISSSWRSNGNYKEVLVEAGLRGGVSIVGKTPVLHGKTRGDEISEYLKEHPEVESYLIFDDDEDMGVHIDKLVKCDPANGFGMNEFSKAVSLHMDQKYNIKRRYQND